MKFIQHPDFLNRLQTTSTHPHLSSFPSSSFTNPGLAPVRLYSFYTPIHSQPDIFTKKMRNVEENDQTGGGELSEDNLEDVPTNDTDLLQQMTKSKLINNTDNPEDFNEKKRKMIDNNQIHNSFIHPKFVKTNSINFSLSKPNVKSIKKQKLLDTKTETNMPGKNAIKHNFKFS